MLRPAGSQTLTQISYVGRQRWAGIPTSTEYIIPQPLTRSVLWYLSCVINVQTLWVTTGKHDLLSQIFRCMKIWTITWTRQKRKANKKKKLQQRGVELVGVENNFSFCISVFLSSQSVCSVAQLTASIWHMAYPVAPCSHFSQRSLIFHREWASLDRQCFCFWVMLTRTFLKNREF